MYLSNYFFLFSAGSRADYLQKDGKDPAMEESIKDQPVSTLLIHIEQRGRKIYAAFSTVCCYYFY